MSMRCSSSYRGSRVLKGEGVPKDLPLRCGIAFLLVIVPLWCYSEDTVRVIFNYNGGVPNSVVVETGVKEKRWLGVSFYPATFKDAIKDGYHLVQEIEKGSFKVESAIDSYLVEYYGSSYEIALWGKKVDKKDCKIENCFWCKSRGFHLENCVFYQTGYFNTLWREKQ